jgi:hypothetical protein
MAETAWNAAFLTSSERRTLRSSANLAPGT